MNAKSANFANKKTPAGRETKKKKKKQKLQIVVYCMLEDEMGLLVFLWISIFLSTSQ